MSNKEKTTIQLLVYAVIIFFCGCLIGFYIGTPRQPKVIWKEQLIEVDNCNIEKWRQLKETDDKLIDLNNAVTKLTVSMQNETHDLGNPVINKNIEDYAIIYEKYIELLEKRESIINVLY